MALNFPDSPTAGQVYTAANKSWTFDGAKWIVTQYDNSINDDVIQYIDNEVTAARVDAEAVRQEVIIFSIALS